MIHILGHLAAGAALTAAVWIAGLALAPPSLAGHRQLARFTVGSAYWIAGLFLLASLGHLDRRGAIILLALAVAILAGRRRVVRAALTEAPKPRLAGAALVVAAFFLPLLGHALTPTVFADSDVYHLTLPRLYLDAGGFRPVPFSVYSHWPQAIELLFAGAMLMKSFMLAKAVHLGFGVLLTCALIGASPRLAGWLAAAFFLANPVVAFELRLAYVDVAHAFFLFVAFLFMDRALEAEDDERTRANLLVSGLAAGIVCGVKLTGFVGAGLVAALYLPRLARAPRPFWLCFALPATLLFLPWLAKAAWMTGNPVYPFLHGVFGGPDWNAELGARFAEWQRSIGMGRSLVDYLLLPLRVILLGGHGYGSFDGEIGGFWIVLVPLALGWALRGSATPRARRALVTSGLYFVFWALSSQQMRFLIPILPLLALAAAEAVVGLVEGAPRFRRAGRSLALVMATLLVGAVQAHHLSGGMRNYAALARVSGDLRASAVPPALRYLNEETPAASRVLMINTNRGFFLEREYLADSFFEASQIAAWLGDATSADEIHRRLAARGITHVLLDPRPRVAWPPALVEMMGDPQRVEVVFRSPDGTRLVLRSR